MYSSNDADHWRRKYTDALASLEQEQRRFRGIEGVLRRLLSRLSAAAQGRSAQLDAELRKLAATLRGDPKEAELEAFLKPLWNAISALGDESVPAPSRPPVAPTSDDDRIRAVLARIVDLVSGDASLAAHARELARELETPWAAGQLPVVLSDVADLVSRRITAVELEKREVVGLLAQVNARLEELVHFLGNENQERKAALAGSRELDERLTADMSALGGDVAQARDLAQVKARVQAGLDRIGAQFSEFRSREEARVRSAQERSDAMRARVDTLEREANDLQGRLREEQRLALVDPLTQIPNRIAYDRRLEEEFNRWRRNSQPVCVVAWDIDNFKAVNDRYGHRAGDKVLRAVAECLASRLRVTDFVARYGGEEFVMILAGSLVADALPVADQIRESVAGLGFHFNGEAMGVTISCGLSPFREGDAPEDAFERADAALYRAKANGRNRCVTA